MKNFNEEIKGEKIFVYGVYVVFIKTDDYDNISIFLLHKFIKLYLKRYFVYITCLLLRILPKFVIYLLNILKMNYNF